MRFTPKGEAVYASFKRHFDDQGFRYTAHEDDHVIQATFGGDDLPMPMIIRVDDEREVITLMTNIPINMPEEKRIDAAVAITIINYQLLNGSFQMDMRDGKIIFSVAQSFCDCEVSDNLIRYLMSISIKSTDEYNDKLFMLGKGLMTLDQFIEQA